ncbi:MAG: glycosyltransferase family 39 protein [Bryobacterales bacterium]|nr:glycosyltransferase family 39 protein [Bryobacterales bacterium]
MPFASFTSRPSRRELVLIAAIVAALCATLATLAFRVGVTVDEPSHLVSAYLYWQGNDWLKPADMPPLLKLTCGWVPRLTGLPLPPPEHDVWTTGHEWNVSQEIMHRMKAPAIRRTFGLSRLPMIVFPAACSLLLWWWARQLFSPAAALLVAAFFSLSPSVLGHGALVKNDVAAAFAFLLFWYRVWRYAKVPTIGNAAWIGFAVGLAAITKFSLLVLVPIAPLVVAVVLWRGTALSRWVLAFAVLVLIPWLMLYLSYQCTPGRIHFTEFQVWKADPNLSVLFVKATRVAYYLWIPASYIRGLISLVQSNASGAGVYLLGDVYPMGSALYFLVALLVKTPIATLLAIASGLLLVIRDRGNLRLTDACWLVPPFLYLGLASLSSLQLGVRLIIPALVFFLLIAGKLFESCMRRRQGQVLIAALMVWLVTRHTAFYPHEMAFFNRLAGGPDSGLGYLSDSNLDWGQDLPQLAGYVRRHRIQKIRVAYFGSDNPWAHLGDEVMEPVAPPWSDDYITGERYQPKPGYYAISGTLLTGQFFRPRYRDYFAEFRSRNPIAKAGYSIWIYRVE